METAGEFFSELIMALQSAVNDANELGINPFNHVEKLKNEIRITTRQTRDWSKANNGGEYEFWTSIYVQDDKIVVQEDWSAEFDPVKWLGEPRIFTVQLSLDDIFEVAESLLPALIQ